MPKMITEKLFLMVFFGLITLLVGLSANLYNQIRIIKKQGRLITELSLERKQLIDDLREIVDYVRSKTEKPKSIY